MAVEAAVLYEEGERVLHTHHSCLVGQTEQVHEQVEFTEFLYIIQPIQLFIFIYCM